MSTEKSCFPCGARFLDDPAHSAVNCPACGEPLVDPMLRDPAWILGRACMRKSTGALRMSFGGAVRTILLGNGVPLFASSTDTSERFGEFLLRKRKILPDQLERALRLATLKSVRLGQALVEMSVLSVDDLPRELAGQHFERALAAFKWAAVESTFTERPVKPAEGQIDRAREALVVTAMRTHYDLNRLKALLPQTRTLRCAPDWEARVGAFGFSRSEAEVLALADGRLPLSELAVRSSNELDSFRCLYAAACFDLVLGAEPHSPAGKSAPASVTFAPMSAPRKALLMIESAGVLTRAEAALKRSGVVGFRFPEIADPIALCAFGQPDLVVISVEQAGAEAELSTRIRALGIPVLLIAPIPGLLEVNAMRKASKANIALPSTFGEDDMVTAIEKLAVEGMSPVASAAAAPSPVELEPSAAVPAASPATAPAPVRTAPPPRAQAVPAAAAAPPAAIESAAPEEPAFAIAAAGLRKFTGELRLTTAPIVRSILFVNGAPVASTSNVPTERLGARLLEKGKIERSQLNKALGASKEKSIQLGAALLEQGALDAAALATELSAQHMDRALALFTMPASMSRLEQRDVAADAAHFLLSSEQLVLEGLRRHYDFARLKGVLANKRIFRLAPGSEARVERAGFSPGEKEALALVDGNRTVSEIAPRAKNILDAMRAIYAASCFEILR